MTSYSKDTKVLPSPIGVAPLKPATSDPTTPTLPDEESKPPSEEFTPALESPHLQPSSSPPMPIQVSRHTADSSKLSKSPEHTAKHVSRRYGVMIDAKDPDKDSDKEDASSYIKLLIALCQKGFGRKPLFMIGRGREGYNCIATIDEDRKEEIAKVTGCSTREESLRFTLLPSSMTKSSSVKRAAIIPENALASTPT
ncbi:hypothetical protein BU25DRAFT_459603 [Macroventuria anomochaeta]|uniref:Uncharacterized protein n=1 Tax=Macroventuria anomochaeta TaxID=301207 RepID=A0ACB6RZW6_9PLEO|nr:uncharacterized protein BU25DRAFT_459603 [Macroventuria anomochaeta]KAF2626484.1 hypothetical protein BU25DRAFT_459603 [Macroventuria anomochaeta]